MKSLRILCIMASVLMLLSWQPVRAIDLNASNISGLSSLDPVIKENVLLELYFNDLKPITVMHADKCGILRFDKKLNRSFIRLRRGICLLVILAYR